MQFEQMKIEYKTEEIYRYLFSYTKYKHIYVTTYRLGSNEGKSYETLAEEILMLAEYGADLCDVSGT